MNNLTPCPQCGHPMARKELMGLCPDCMLKAGLGSLADDTIAGQAARFEPPAVSEIANKFPNLDVIELLGCGGMGAVYKSRQKNLDRFVALKILPPDIGSAPAFAERFVREAKALAKLSHPNIVTIHDFGQADGLFFLLMEFVDGVNLGQLLRAGRISPREALAIVPQICDALQYAHDHGIVHRDIKPENILLDRQGRVKVADFGLAKLVGQADFTAHDGTSSSIGNQQSAISNAVMGTPQYMAPEQVAHPSDVDHRADIYSLGVVFYQMLTGELPKGDFAPPSKKVVVDVRLDEVVLRAMERRPELRYQHVSDVKTMVETIATTPPPAGEAGVPPIVPGGAPVIPPPKTFWQMLKSRLWPPMVVRRNGQRVINWPAVAMHGIRGLLLLIPIAAIFIVGGISSHESGRIAWFGVAWLVLGPLILSAVLAVRVLRGFSRPLNELPDLDNPVNKGTAPVASQKWQAPTMGWGHFIGYLQGMTFTSPLAYKLANFSALGFLCFLGFMPLPGWKGCFGFSGFFGLIGLSTLIEMIALSKARRSGSNNQQPPRALDLNRWQGVLLRFVLLLLSVAAFVIILRQVISPQNPDAIQQAAGTQGSAFSPVIERVLPFDRSFIDFQTGRILCPNLDKLHLTPKGGWAQWERQNGADALADEAPTLPGLGDCDFPRLVAPSREKSEDKERCVFVCEETDDFDSVRPGDADARLKIVTEQNFYWGLAYGSRPWWFQTLDGAKGVLQIVCTNDQPRGLKIRYKLVQSEKPAPPLERSKFPLGEVFLRNKHSLRLVHDNISTHYVLFYEGLLEKAEDRSTHNRSPVLWLEDGTIKLPNGRTFVYSRVLADAGTDTDTMLTINGRTFDLRDGRVLVLKDDGGIEQLKMFPQLSVSREPDALALLIAKARDMDTGPVTPDKLRAQWRAAEDHLDDLSERYNARHPLVMEAQHTIEELRKKIAASNADGTNAAAVFGLQAERMIAATDANPDGVVAFRFENNFPFQPPVAVTGHFKDPSKIGFTPELRRWMQDENVDLLFYFDKKAYYVLSFNMRTGWAGQPKEWDTILPDCAVPQLTKMEKLNSEPAGPSIMGECGYRDGLGEVCVFRTRDGLVGFYQLRGLSDTDGRGVNIRYKLVQAGATNAAAVAKPAPAATKPAFVNAIGIVGKSEDAASQQTAGKKARLTIVSFSIPSCYTQPVVKNLDTKRTMNVDVLDADLRTLLAHGTLVAVDNQIDEATGMLACKAMVSPTKDALLYPNQFVNVRLFLEAQPGTATESATNAASALDQLQGIWQGFEAGREGLCKLTVAQNIVQFQGVETHEWYHAKFELISGTGPLQIRSVITECPEPRYVGKVNFAILAIENDRLTFVANEPGDPTVPKVFEGDDHSRHFAFKKVTTAIKPAPADAAPAPKITTEQVIVEDLALQMLVAIREKDDSKLRALACDDVKGWRDALPSFAVEMREHYRQLTGNEAFDLRAVESLVDGHLAVVKCTGPKELNGMYLVLFFVKTDDGWRNHSLRNSPPSTSLAQHLVNFKKEFHKKKNAAATTKPTPAGEANP